MFISDLGFLANAPANRTRKYTLLARTRLTLSPMARKFYISIPYKYSTACLSSLRVHVVGVRDFSDVAPVGYIIYSIPCPGTTSGTRPAVRCR